MMRTMRVCSGCSDDNVLYVENDGSEEESEDSTAGEQVVRPRAARSRDDVYGKASQVFQMKLVENPFGHACDVCDRLWFASDLSLITMPGAQLMSTFFPEGIERTRTFRVCNTCRQSLRERKGTIFERREWLFISTASG